MDNGTPALSGTATITVNLTDVNEAPIVNAATFGLAENSANGTVVGTVTFTPQDTGQTHTFAITAGNTGGAFAINPSTGQITVATSSAVNFETTPSFSLTVEVTDSGVPALTGTATITVNLTNANDVPLAASQTESTPEDTAKEITLSATDQDHLTLTFSIVGTPQHGGLSAVTHDPCTPDGTGGATCTAKVTYTPTGNFSGPDSFTFKVNDTIVDSNTATITVNVNALTDAPVANNQTPSTAEDTPLLITLSGVDVDGHNLTFSPGTGPTNGSLNLPFSAPVCQPPDSNGAVTCTATVTYSPNSQFNGPDSFTFTVNNTVTDSAAGTVSITVSATNDPPVAADVPGQTTAEETVKTITLTASDIDSLSLTFSVDDPPHGSVSAVTPIGCTPDGSGGATCTATVDYTPDLHYNGPDSFTYRANDGTSDSNTATVSITVTPVNDPPIANPQSVSTPEVTPLPITLTGTDVETANANLTFAVTVNPTHGGLTGTAPNLTYTPAADYVGPDSFQFTVTDRGDPDNCGAPGPACTAPIVSPAGMVSITVTCPTITVNGTIPNLNLNQAMATATFTQTGANGPVTWSATGLPTGVSINASSGDVTGTPTVSGPFSATITATETSGCTGSKNVTFNVSQPPAITSGNATTFTVGQAGSFSVTTTGVPTVTSIVMGSVTPGPAGRCRAG